MNVDDIAVLDSEVVANDTVHPSTPIVKVIIGQNDQHCILSLLALDENRVASEKL